MTTSNATLPTRLNASSRDALAAHFLSLGPDDRRLRFGAAIADELVHEYVGRIDFERDEVFAVTDDDLVILGVVHVAFSDDPEGTAELGLSVVPKARGHGVGNALFERAVMHLRNRGARSVFMHCLSENRAIMHLAHKHGMRIAYEGGESEGRLRLKAPNAESFVTEWIREQQAHAFESMKRNARIARRMLAPYARG